MEDIQLCEATADDKTEILLINDNVFDGMDYLQDYFDDFVACPVTKLYKAVYKDEIISFIVATLVDDGETVVSRAARVKPNYAGRGVFKMLRQYSTEMSIARINAFIASNALEAAKKLTFQQINSLIMSRSLQRYDFNVDNVRLDLVSTNIPEALTKSTLQHFMTSDFFKAYLFPQSRIVIDWVPFRLLLSNIEIFWGRDDGRSLRLTDIHLVSGQPTGLMSFSKIYLSQNRTNVCTIDVYGTDGNSTTQHIVAHLSFLRDQAVTNTSVWIITDPTLECITIEKLFKDLSLEKTDWIFSADSDTTYTEQCLYEKQLKVDGNNTF